VLNQKIIMKKSKHTELPAFYVILHLGGIRQVASACNVTPSAVSRWATPIVDGGTGGVIPQRHWPALIAAAQKRHASLSIDQLAGADSFTSCIEKTSIT
jgi:hypothetical protein